MKKVLTIIIATIFLCLIITGCGNKGKLHITTPDGEEMNLTWEELYAIEKENPLNYEEKYNHSIIEFTDEVDEIGKSYYDGYVASDNLFQEISFKNCGSVTIVAGSHDDILKKIKVGDSLRVITKYHIVYSKKIGVNDISDKKSNGKYIDNTKLEIVD